MNKIILTAINAKWIHPSLALRLLKANLGDLENTCKIVEFALRQPLAEKVDALLAESPSILGISVSIWNHSATIELLEALENVWITRPVIVFGGPEVSHLHKDAKIFKYADYVIRGEGENAFRLLCETLTSSRSSLETQEIIQKTETQFINAPPVDLNQIKSAYHLYTDEDIEKKLIYVEASRGCPFACDFCLSAVDVQTEFDNPADTKQEKVREFPLDAFLKEMDVLIKRGVKTFKFLDRTFNANTGRENEVYALRIINFFLEKMNEYKTSFVVHFEMIAQTEFVHLKKPNGLNESELMKALARFPPGTLRLEIGIQTLNKDVAARIHRPSNPQKEMEVLQFLREKTNAVIHADLIAGLPGEDLASFAEGFDRLWQALSDNNETEKRAGVEIQLGILKQLPGTPISRHNEKWGMRFNRQPPYEIEETSSISAEEIQRIKNFARFWEIIVNRGLKDMHASLDTPKNQSIFWDFMALSDSLLSRFGKNWGIDKNKLLEAI
ncbi:MAG: B12-binding domain-containing radical SAM protein [Treponema sp.]|nr:B12-binding domain-containing radical SAM protein [Treponema sp.]MCL2250422.1 B12-binding domain-containing radical SAM protein [Treponema sp.]